MALISYSDYRNLADQLADARDSMASISTYALDAVYDVVMLQDVDQEIDLLYEFWDTYVLSTESFGIPSSLLTAVRALQKHVLVRGGYDDIDDYLTDVGGTVPQSFADMSEAAGYPVTLIG